MKPAPNDIDASCLPSSGVDPCQSHATATSRNQGFDWEGAGTVTFSRSWALHSKALSGDTGGCISIESGDKRTSDKGGKGMATPVTMYLPRLFISPPFFTNRTDVFWKLKFCLQINKSASVFVKCIPYLIAIAITVTATSNPKSKAESGPTQNRSERLEAATHTLCYTYRNSCRRAAGAIDVLTNENNCLNLLGTWAGKLNLETTPKAKSQHSSSWRAAPGGSLWLTPSQKHGSRFSLFRSSSCWKSPWS